MLFSVQHAYSQNCAGTFPNNMQTVLACASAFLWVQRLWCRVITTVTAEANEVQCAVEITEFSDSKSAFLKSCKILDIVILCISMILSPCTNNYYGRSQCGVKITVHSVTEQQSDQLGAMSFYTFNLLDISIAQYNWIKISCLLKWWWTVIVPVQCVHNRRFWFCDMRIEVEFCMTAW